jgi:hypothetical protein
MHAVGGERWQHSATIAGEQRHALSDGGDIEWHHSLAGSKMFGGGVDTFVSGAVVSSATTFASNVGGALLASMVATSRAASRCCSTLDVVLRWTTEAAIEQRIGSGQANAGVLIVHQRRQHVDRLGSVFPAELLDIKLGLRTAVWIAALAWFPEPWAIL